MRSELLLPVQPIHLDDETEELATGQLVVKIGLIRNVSEHLVRLLARGGKSADGDRALVRGQKTANHLDRGRLAGAIGPEKGEELAGTHLEIKPIYGAFGTVTFSYTHGVRSWRWYPGLDRRITRIVLPAFEHQTHKRERHFLAENESLEGYPRTHRKRREMLHDLECRHGIAAPGDVRPPRNFNPHPIELPRERD